MLPDAITSQNPPFNPSPTTIAYKSLALFAK